MAENQNTTPRFCRLCGSVVTKKTGRLCSPCIVERRDIIAGDPDAPRLSKRERVPLWDRLLAHRRIEESTGCWIWTASRDSQGYGHISNVYIDGLYIGGIVVHRLVAHLRLGLDLSRPREIYACHRCDNPPCFNPDHLFVGTAKDNSDDCKRKGRERHQIGEENGGGGKLTSEQVREIKRMYSVAQYTQTQIAERFGVHHSMVNRIVLGKAWRHVA